jgi:hypothetical protein
MIDENATAEDLLRAALRKLRDEEEALRREYDVRLDALYRRIYAVRTALGDDDDTGTVATEQEPLRLPAIALPASATRASEVRLPPTRWARILSGVSQTEALIRIAIENGGILRVSDAKRILIDAGKVRGQHKNVPGHIYHLVHASEKFEKVAPGVFRLLSATPDDSDQTAASIPEQPGFFQNTGSIPSS